MDPKRLQTYRRYSKLLNPKGLYRTGTAIEAIQYYAGGTTLDWLDSLCQRCLAHGQAGVRFVELAMHGTVTLCGGLDASRKCITRPSSGIVAKEKHGRPDDTELQSSATQCISPA